VIYAVMVWVWSDILCVGVCMVCDMCYDVGVLCDIWCYGVSVVCDIWRYRVSVVFDIWCECVL
jgi:hypothetical protein